MTVRVARTRKARPLGLLHIAVGQSRLAQRIVLTCLAVAAVSLLAALLALVPAAAMGPELWMRAAGAVLVASAAALALGSWLAGQVAEPIAEFLRVVDAGWARHAGGRPAPVAMRLPETAGRSDEIGQLSSALQRLVVALSDRIAANENLAADVAHEIRNPLASLRSAAEALRVADEERRARLVEIIQRDVARLDRLVGEVSNASRLDAELVREQAVEFDLVATMQGLVDHLAHGATAKGIEIISDLPPEPLPVVGLEARLAQVAVNIIGNAVSLCEGGDAIRVWVRRRDRRVLIVIEDTGPGITDGDAEKIFHRFYSHRPAEQFGDNSGLGLAISRQIVEAHDGVIWAENIRPTESDILSEPLGARFVVVLPL